jgi:hypothetical protein
MTLFLAVYNPLPFGSYSEFAEWLFNLYRTKVTFAVTQVKV